MNRIPRGRNKEFDRLQHSKYILWANRNWK